MLTKLSSLLSEIRALTDVCTKCGICQSVCPVYKATHKEQGVARGKIAVLEGLAEEILSGSPASLKIIEQCLLCGACEKKCPRKVQTTEIFLKARQILHHYQGISPVKRALLRQIVAKPERLKAFLSLTASVGALWPGKPIKIQSKRLSPSVQPVMNMLFSGSGNKKAKRKKPSGTFTKRAALFTGCLMPEFFPEVIDACIDVAAVSGVKLDVIHDAGCCGMPSASQGDITSFNKLVDHNIPLLTLAPFDYIVSPCATCTFTLKKIWPLLSEKRNIQTQTAILAISEKAIDLSTFFLSIAPDGLYNRENTNRSNKTITFHDSCHLKQGLGITAAPRQILKASGHQFVDMGSIDSCCGSGGAFGFKEPDISRITGTKLAGHIQQTDADCIVATCPGCMLQIKGLLALNNVKMDVCHIAEIAAGNI